jgi:hypothetical protein
MRALLYTTPTVMAAAKTVTIVVKTRMFLADVSSNVLMAADLIDTVATLGMALSCL